jgi:hypothetical protein
VLEAVFAETTVIPCSFGTILASRETAEAHVLEDRAADLRGLFERLEGRLQLNVKIAYDEEHVLKEIVESEPEIAHLREMTRRLGNAAYYENLRLGEVVAAALAELRARDANRYLERLASTAEEIVVDEPSDDTLVLKASVLIADERLDAFNAVLDALAASEAPRIRLESIGPLPPTAFATLGTEA